MNIRGKRVTCALARARLAPWRTPCCWSRTSRRSSACCRDFLAVEGFGVARRRRRRRGARRARRPATSTASLLDVMLPGGSGFDVCRRIREHSDVPLLFLSARGEDEDKLRGLALGADDYIVKSATPAEVVARVKAVLRRSAPRRRRAAAALRALHARPRGARGDRRRPPGRADGARVRAAARCSPTTRARCSRASRSSSAVGLVGRSQRGRGLRPPAAREARGRPAACS